MKSIKKLIDRKILKVVLAVCESNFDNEFKKKIRFRLVSGRGLLGHWGPNHAGDPVVTRWAKNTKEKILEIILVKRKDTGELALPGGMVDAG
jgi:hypothetical protein